MYLRTYMSIATIKGGIEWYVHMRVPSRDRDRDRDRGHDSDCDPITLVCTDKQSIGTLISVVISFI